MIAFGVCAAAGIRDLDNAGFAVYVGVLTALTLLLWLGCRVRFTPDEPVVRRMWLRRRIPWTTVAHCELFKERGPAGESNTTAALEWLGVRLRDGRRVGLLPILGGLTEHAVATTPLGRRTERLMATALTELHTRGLTLGAAEMRAVHAHGRGLAPDPAHVERRHGRGFECAPPLVWHASVDLPIRADCAGGLGAERAARVGLCVTFGRRARSRQAPLRRRATSK